MVKGESGGVMAGSDGSWVMGGSDVLWAAAMGDGWEDFFLKDDGSSAKTREGTDKDTN